jgi:hypothetical protein
MSIPVSQIYIEASQPVPGPVNALGTEIYGVTETTEQLSKKGTQT